MYLNHVSQLCSWLSLEEITQTVHGITTLLHSLSTALQLHAHVNILAQIPVPMALSLKPRLHYCVKLV